VAVPKLKTVFACQACGFESSKWLGRCPDCGEWNSFVEERQEAAPSRAKAPGPVLGGRPQPYDMVDGADAERIPTGLGEFDRVLGGGIVPGSMILIGGEPGIGKCLVGSSRVLDPVSGSLLPITEWAQKQRDVVSLDESTRRLVPQTVAAFHEQGERPVVELKTRLGRTLRCTSTHPVLTPSGWKAAGDLAPGALLAAPRSLPYFGNERMAEHEVKLAAYVLSDGSAHSDVNVTTAVPEVRNDLHEVARRFGLELGEHREPNNAAKTYRFVQPRGYRADARKRVARSLRRVHAITGVTWAGWARAAGHATAATKAVPDCIFRLPSDQLRLFLKVLFSCDGSVYLNRRGQAGVSYSTISERLARDVQHLLLRFGFVSRLRTKNQQVNGRPYVSYEVRLLGVRAVKRYLAEIGIWGRQSATSKIDQRPEPRLSSTHLDTVPTGQGFWTLLRTATGGVSFAEISARAGVFVENRRHERPLPRTTVGAIANAYPSVGLEALAHGQIYWDEVKSVTPAGQERVYDLSVPSHANFVANDLIVHNSTLITQVAHLLGRNGAPVLYVSGEESPRQIKLRGERLGVSGSGLYLMGETSLERILEEVDELKPSALVIDSVQTVYSSKFPSAPGSISQVREVATQLLFLAKGRGITTFLIGHVTKDGSLAGPKSLEHIVDTVLYFEGEKRQHHRIVRAVKNRFGAVSELGVFEMTGTGLQPVANPSALFLSERREGSPGSAVVATVEGSRPMLVEVQALVSPSSFGTPRRMSLGIDPNRTSLLLAVLEKRVGLELLGDDVFVSVAGGLDVAEPAADLGVVAAVASSLRNRPLPADTVVFGEVGLAGEVRSTGQALLRVREAAQMGFKRCVLPARSVPPGVDGIQLLGVHTLSEALDRLHEPT
jgi:DNA repair protein RadA/Sms